MSKYPVETSDLDGVIAGVNYLLSGPSGLGQNFSGTSNVDTMFLSGNFFTNGAAAPIGSTNPISVSLVENIDNYSWKLTFASTQAYAPFNIGNRIIIGSYPIPILRVTPIGVQECTTDYVIVRWPNEVDLTYFTSGTVDVWFTFYSDDVIDNNFTIPTYANCLATVNNATDRVFLSGQVSGVILGIDNTTSAYDATINFRVQINRYITTFNSNGENTTATYTFDKTIVQQFKQIIVAAGSSPTIEYDGFYFTSFIDTPPNDVYTYRLEFYFPYDFASLDAKLTLIRVDASSLTSQVVKQ